MSGIAENMNLVAEFSRLESEMNGSRGTALHALRKQALDAVVRQGMPTTEEEEWKYTNLNSLNRSEFRCAGRGAFSAADLAALQIPHLGGDLAVLVNGFYEPSLSSVGASPDVSVIPLSVFLKQSEAGETKALFDNRASRYTETGNVFPALNTAFARDGVVIRVRRGAVSKAPVHLVHVAAVSDSARRATCPRHLIVLEENSEATIVESFFSAAGESPITVHLTQLELLQGARCTHLKIQQERIDSSHISYIDVSLAKDTRLSQLLCTVGGGLVRNEIRPVISGSGSECLMRGLTVIGGKQHVDNATVIDHAVSHAQSTEVFKGVFGGEATSAFSGTIIVRKDAQKTNAIQSNDSILLSDRATINSRPQLKIWADDVKCTHGATVGQLREDALHYLRTRGIPLETARQMLIEAFSGEIVGSIEHPELRFWVAQMLQQKLQEVLKEV